MCGIAAVWDWSGRGVPLVRLRAMTDAQAHRGPDGFGLAAWSPEVGTQQVAVWRGPISATPTGLPPVVRLGLGHTLLAVQDPSPEARQPMGTADGRHWIVFNGEIYNFLELRRELNGHHPRTRTDTEVVLDLWAKAGPAILPRLRGMFALAFYDAALDTLWLARDRFGIKPLYYARYDEGVVIASEFRGIHASGLIRRRWNEAAVRAFLAAAVNKPDDRLTFFDGVLELPPGCLLRIRPGEIELGTYYTLPEVGGCAAGAEQMPAIEALLDDVVGLHMRSAREVGVCLSGGLDSSTIAHTVVSRTDRTNSKLHAFTVGASGSMDVELARRAATALGVDQCICDVSGRPELADVVDMIVACETPNHTWGPINPYQLLREVRREGIQVLLTGHGGDEVLSAYPWFLPPIRAFIAGRRGQAAADALRAAYIALAPMPADILRTVQRMYNSRRVWIDMFDGGARAALDASVDDVMEWDAVRYFVNDAVDWPTMSRQQMLRRELPHHLRQEDRLAMWFSIESRVPFLDHALVELFAAVEPGFLFKDGYAKYPLRLLAPKLPAAVRWETRKKGYWENHGGAPPFGELTARAVAASRVLREYVPRPEHLARLTPLTAWRFFQMAVLAEGVTSASAGDWAMDLVPTPRHTN